MRLVYFQFGVRRLLQLALIGALGLASACTGPALVHRDSAPATHRVQVASPGPWTPEPSDRSGPPLNQPPDRPVVPPGQVASVADGLPLTSPRPDPRPVMPGEAAIHEQAERADGDASNTPRTGTTTPRSEILPRPEAGARSLHAAWLAGSAYNQRYRPDQVELFDAVVQAVETFVPAEGAEPGLLLRVSAQGQERLIHVAPLSSLRDRGTRFNYQDAITVLASPTQFAGQTVYVAGQITRGETRLSFRDQATGRPLWDDAAAP